MSIDISPISEGLFSINIKFHVGSQYCIVTLNTSGEEQQCEETLRQFFSVEQVPEYLHNSIRSAVFTALKQERSEPIVHSELVLNKDKMIKGCHSLHQQRLLTCADPEESTDGQNKIQFNKIVEQLYALEEAKDSLVSLEQSFTMTMLHLQGAHTEAIANLRERHSREMERASIGEQGNRIALLVEKQVQEMESLETQLQSEIDEAKKRQKLEYRAFAMDLYKHKEKYVNHGYKSTRSDLKAPTPSTPKESPVLSRKSYSITSLFKKSMKDTQNDSNPIISEEDMCHTFVVLLGNQLKKPVQIKVQASSILSLCRTKNESDIVEPVYGNSLKACVLMVDSNISGTSQEYNAFIKQCQKTTELQFEDIEAQLSKVKEKLGNSLQLGDFFITTHSNLKDVHVIFHLAVNRKHDNDVTKTLINGLRNIFVIANRYDIESITFPVLLIQNELKHLLQDEDAKARVDAVVTSLKVFLLENAATNTIKSINFVVPSISNDQTIYDHTKRKVAQAFNLH